MNKTKLTHFQNLCNLLFFISYLKYEVFIYFDLIESLKNLIIHDCLIMLLYMFCQYSKVNTFYVSLHVFYHIIIWILFQLFFFSVDLKTEGFFFYELL